MNYDIRNVGNEYLLAEECRKNGDIEQAIEHYQSAVDNYNRADNEYLLNPDKPYKVVEANGKTYTFPSVNEMVGKSYGQLAKLRKRKK